MIAIVNFLKQDARGLKDEERRESAFILLACKERSNMAHLMKVHDVLSKNIQEDH